MFSPVDDVNLTAFMKQLFFFDDQAKFLQYSYMHNTAMLLTPIDVTWTTSRATVKRSVSLLGVVKGSIY